MGAGRQGSKSQALALLGQAGWGRWQGRAGEGPESFQAQVDPKTKTRVSFSPFSLLAQVWNKVKNQVAGLSGKAWVEPPPTGNSSTQQQRW